MHLTADDLAEFRVLDAAEKAAWRAINGDDEIEAAWKTAADKVRAFREARGLVGYFISLKDGWYTPNEE